jgi:hypothetical protein
MVIDMSLSCAYLTTSGLVSNVVQGIYPFASAWNRCNKPKIDAITCYYNNLRLVGRRSKLSSSNRVYNIFLVWLQMFGYYNVGNPCKI